VAATEEKATADGATPSHAAAAGASGSSSSTLSELPTDTDALESVFIFCVVWSVGGALRAASRERFDAFVKKICGRATVQGAGKGHVPIASLYDHYFDLRDLR